MLIFVKINFTFVGLKGLFLTYFMFYAIIIRLGGELYIPKTGGRSMEIRRATVDDLPVIQRMLGELLQYEKAYDSTLKSAWVYSEDSKEKLSKLIENDVVLIAEEVNYPIGYLVGKIDGTVDPVRVEKHAHISNLYVVDFMRQAGVATGLTNEFKTICKEVGVESLTVSVLSDNSVALSFYYKMGFLPRTTILQTKI